MQKSYYDDQQRCEDLLYLRSSRNSPNFFLRSTKASVSPIANAKNISSTYIGTHSHNRWADCRMILHNAQTGFLPGVSLDRKLLRNQIFELDKILPCRMSILLRKRTVSVCLSNGFDTIDFQSKIESSCCFNKC